MTEDRTPDRARGTDRLLDILDFLGGNERAVTAGEVAAAIEAPRSSVYTIVDSLVLRGYLSRSREGMLSLGHRIAVLGQAFERHSSIVQAARVILRELAAESGEIAELNVLDGWKQLVLIAENGPRQFYMRSVEGGRYPVPRTASGRFLVSRYSESEIAASIPENDFMLGDGSLLSISAFMEQIEEARSRRIVITRGLIDPNIGYIAAPIVNQDGFVNTAISLVLPIVEFEVRRDRLVRLVRGAAGELNSKLEARLTL